MPVRQIAVPLRESHACTGPTMFIAGQEKLQVVAHFVLTIWPMMLQLIATMMSLPDTEYSLALLSTVVPQVASPGMHSAPHKPLNTEPGLQRPSSVHVFC